MRRLALMRFDEHAIPWTKYDEVNATFIRQEITFIKAKFAYRGYIYLNEIYDAFGMKWDPEDENVCYMKSEGELIIEFERCVITDAYLIKIY